jgi:thiosulfate/3-mercaptopyruvate sulfurtransferase
MTPAHTTLIDAPTLLALRAEATALHLFDCSFDLMNPAAADGLYAEGHVPGALHLHLERHLSEHRPGAPRTSGGRHPLPTREAFAATLRALGLNKGAQVVVMDRQGGFYAGRAWWMLKWCGHEAVALLNGGWNAWRAAGGAVATGPHLAPVPLGDFDIGPCAAPVCDTATLQQRLGTAGQVVLDARAAARFRGETEPLDPVAGHIPGALNRPFTENFAADGCFKPAAQLRQEFEALLAGRPASAVVHHCGSGVSAIPNLLAMEVAGLGRSTLYPGSWSEWCNTPGLPCARG